VNAEPRLRGTDKVEEMSEFKPFEPHGWLRNGHLQTIAGSFLRRKFALPAGEERLFRVDPETQLKGICHWQGRSAGASQTRGGHAKDWPVEEERPRDLRLELCVGDCGEGMDAGISFGADEPEELRRYGEVDADSV